MATALGKRKRASAITPREHLASEPSASDTEDLQEIFRRHFEAKFKPLPSTTKNNHRSTDREELKTVEDGDSEDDTASWGGLSASSSQHEADEDIELEYDSSDDDSDVSNDYHYDAASSRGASMSRNGTVQIIDHSAPLRYERASRADHKAFMSARPPSRPTTTTTSSTSHTSKPDAADAEDEAANARHDADLQKLLRESHLLSSSASSGPSSMRTSSSTRHAAMDLHLQSLGASASTGLKYQAKMPMGMRRGIERARVEGESRRREEARQLGVVLEREVKKGSGKEKRRDRGIGAPSVGTFRGGTLRLSGRDVRSIRGGERGRGRGRGRGGRRR